MAFQLPKFEPKKRIWETEYVFGKIFGGIFKRIWEVLKARKKVFYAKKELQRKDREADTQQV